MSLYYDHNFQPFLQLKLNYRWNLSLLLMHGDKLRRSHMKLLPLFHFWRCQCTSWTFLSLWELANFLRSLTLLHSLILYPLEFQSCVVSSWFFQQLVLKFHYWDIFKCFRFIYQYLWLSSFSFWSWCLSLNRE